MESLFSYISYRRFLADFYAYHKDHTKGFSYRSFSADVGVSLVNFLPWLIDGSRNLADKTIPGVIKACHLSEEEGAYFTLLVHFEQAKTQDTRNELFKEITTIRSEKKVNHIAEEQYKYFSHWSIVAIRELLNIFRFHPKSKGGYQKLGAMLRPRVNKTEARRAVKTLLSLGFAELDEEGYVVLTMKQVTTGDEAPGFFIREYHKQLLKRAEEAMDLFPADKRDLSSIAMSVSEAGQNEIKKAIQKFRREVEEIVKSDSDPDRLVQLSTQLYPFAELPNE